MRSSNPPPLDVPADGQHGASASSSALLRAAALIVVVLTVIAFAPGLGNEFVDWDDKQTLVRNDAYRGLSLEHVRWMLTTGFAGHYQPLTWLSFAIDWHVYGLAPWGFHLTNLLLHAATGVGFFFVARRLFAAALPGPTDAGLVVGALAAALLFAVHPLRVESVAWATERRDVLSGVWLMAATLLYLRAVEPGRSGRRRALLGLTGVCYVLSLGSKAAGITWPAVLLLLDVYPLRRFAPSPGCPGRITPRRILLEKALFALPAAVCAGGALWAQAQTGALRTFTEHSPAVRIGQAFFGLMFYPVKTLWPTRLVPLYEQAPDAGALDLPNVVSALAVVVLTVLFWRIRRSRPAWLTAWGVYVVTVAPVLGLAQSGPQVVADRYSYLSCLPFAVLAGGAVARWWSVSTGRNMRRVATVTACIVIVSALVLLTRSQTRIWADSHTLWTTVIERAHDTPTAHANLAIVLSDRGEYEAARLHCREALRILPGKHSAHVALARASVELGDLATAEKHFRIAIELYEAIDKTDPATMVGLAYIKSELGDDEEAERLYRRVIEIDPDVATWHHNLAGFLARCGREREAAAVFQEAIRTDPTYADARFRLAVLLLRFDEPAAAIATLEEGLKHTPDDAPLSAKLARVLSTCKTDGLRDGQRALQLARRATAASKETTAPPQEALAAALAETGDFAGAVDTLTKLLADKNTPLMEKTRRRLERELERYRQEQPLRE